MGKFHKNIVNFIYNHSNKLNDIFLVYTSGSGIKNMESALKKN